MASLSLEGIQKVYSNDFRQLKTSILKSLTKIIIFVGLFRMWKINNTSYDRRS